MLNNSISIRNGSLSDIDIICDLLAEYLKFYNCNISSTQLHEFVSLRLNNNESNILIAYLKNQPAGIAQLYFTFSTLALGKVSILNDLFVTKKFRGNGIGKKLTDEAIKLAQANDAIRMDLKTAHSNSQAIKLYEKIGFEKNRQFIELNYPL